MNKNIDLDYSFCLKETKPNDCCPICCEDFYENEKIHLTNCIHYFHHSCLLKYINTITKDSYNCPLCKTLIKKVYEGDKNEMDKGKLFLPLFSGGLSDLVKLGAIDKYLTGSNEITFFNAKYKSFKNFF
jgi:hypothetical protein